MYNNNYVNASLIICWREIKSLIFFSQNYKANNRIVLQVVFCLMLKAIKKSTKMRSASWWKLVVNAIIPQHKISSPKCLIIDLCTQNPAFAAPRIQHSLHPESNIQLNVFYAQCSLHKATKKDNIKRQMRAKQKLIQ